MSLKNHLCYVTFCCFGYSTCCGVNNLDNYCVLCVVYDIRFFNFNFIRNRSATCMFMHYGNIKAEVAMSRSTKCGSVPFFVNCCR